MANDIAAANAGLGPAVETAAGKLRGASAAGIHSFKGVPYAASPTGSNRFMPPRPAQPWAGVRDALAYSVTPGNCPTGPSAARYSKRFSARRTRHKRVKIA